jgi:hypothetical protein
MARIVLVTMMMKIHDIMMMMMTFERVWHLVRPSVWSWYHIVTPCVYVCVCGAGGGGAVVCGQTKMMGRSKCSGRNITSSVLG